jgi:hypothetical protein
VKTEVLVRRCFDCANRLGNYMLQAVISEVAIESGVGPVVWESLNSKQQVAETVIHSCSTQMADSDGVKACWRRVRTDVGMQKQSLENPTYSRGWNYNIFLPLDFVATGWYLLSCSVDVQSQTRPVSLAAARSCTGLRRR